MYQKSILIKMGIENQKLPSRSSQKVVSLNVITAASHHYLIVKEGKTPRLLPQQMFPMNPYLTTLINGSSILSACQLFRRYFPIVLAYPLRKYHRSCSTLMSTCLQEDRSKELYSLNQLAFSALQCFSKAWNFRYTLTPQCRSTTSARPMLD